MKFIKLINTLFLIVICTESMSGQGVPETMKALYMKDYDKAKEIIESGIDVNQKERGSYLLHVACYRGNYEIVKLLLEKDADVHAIAGDGSTALIQAGRGDETGKIIQLLITKGADVNAKDKNGTTAFIKAIFNVCASKEKQSLTPLEVLLDNGAKIDYSPPEEGSKRYSPLMVAINWDKYELVQFLVNKGADVNYSATDGTTPLMVACKKGNLEIVKFLINAADAKKDISRDNNETALQIAEKEDHKEIIEYLKK